MGRHRQEQPAARPQQRGPGRERLRVVLDVLQYLERAHHAELVARQLLRSDVAYLALAERGEPGRRDGARLAVRLDAEVAVPPREPGPEGSPAAAHLENLGDGGGQHPFDDVVAQPRIGGQRRNLVGCRGRRALARRHQIAPAGVPGCPAGGGWVPLMRASSGATSWPGAYW